MVLFVVLNFGDRSIVIARTRDEASATLNGKPGQIIPWEPAHGPFTVTLAGLGG